MADAKKCDFCGALYESYNTRNNSDKTNAIKLLNRDARGQYFSHGPYDCCPKCMESIKNTIDSLDTKKTDSEVPVYTHCDKKLNSMIAELMDDFDKLVEKARSYGLDIRLYDTSETLVLYYNDDYPDTLLVDKDLSSIKKEKTS